MLSQFDIADFQFSLFVLANWACTAISAALLIYLYKRQRFRLLKPGMLIVVCHHILIQWPSMLYASYLQTWLREPWHFVYLVHGFVLGGILLSGFSGANSVRVMWSSLMIRNTDATDHVRRNDIWALALFGLICVAIYLAYVPIQETGLFVLLTDPGRAAQARENSLKLLDSPVPAYAFSIFTGTIAPFLTAITVYGLAKSRSDRTLRARQYLMVLACAWISALLPGAKGNLVQLILVALSTWWIVKGARIRPVSIVLGVLVALVPAILVSIFLSASDDSIIGSGPAENVLAQTEAIAQRAFVVPLEVGTWYMHYEQNLGPFGMAGMPRFSPLLDVDGVDVPNVIGLAYGPEYYGHEVMASISATAGFVFANYAYFGLFAVFLNLLLLLLCDIVPLFIVEFTSNRFYIPLFAMFMAAALKFLQSDYFTVWLTHGFALVVILAFVLSWQNRSVADAHALNHSVN